MIEASLVTPKWVKIVLRTIGTVNATAVLLGASFLVSSVYRLLTGQMADPTDAPYFRFAFAIMTLINLVFVSVLLVTAIRFIRAKLSAANLYSLTVLLLIVYFVATVILWRIGQGLGTSVAAATAVSSGTGVFEFLFLVPFLYPVMSMVFVQLLKYRYGNRQTPISARQRSSVVTSTLQQESDRKKLHL
jgi:hypothetical protein